MATTVRLPNRVEQALAAYCVDSKRTKSEVIVELLEQRFMTQTEAAPYELAQEAGFIGSFSSVGASGNKRKTATDTKAQVKAAIAAKHSKP